MSAVLGARPAGPVICVTEIPRIARQDRFMAAGTVDVAGFHQWTPSLTQLAVSGIVAAFGGGTASIPVDSTTGFASAAAMGGQRSGGAGSAGANARALKRHHDSNSVTVIRAPGCSPSSARRLVARKSTARASSAIATCVIASRIARSNLSQSGLLVAGPIHQNVSESGDSASGGHPEDSERLAEIETELSIADEYGTFNSLADVLSQIGHDERVHA